MKIEIITEKSNYKFGTVKECRREINKRLHFYTGALLPLIIKAFGEEHVKKVYIERVNVYES